jgi:hypothetical protein
MSSLQGRFKQRPRNKFRSGDSNPPRWAGRRRLRSRIDAATGVRAWDEFRRTALQPAAQTLRENTTLALVKIQLLLRSGLCVMNSQEKNL